MAEVFGATSGIGNGYSDTRTGLIKEGAQNSLLAGTKGKPGVLLLQCRSELPGELV